MPHLSSLKMEMPFSQVYLKDINEQYKTGFVRLLQFTYSSFTPVFLLLGYVFNRGGYVELSKKLSLPLGCTLDRY